MKELLKTFNFEKKKTSRQQKFVKKILSMERVKILLMA